MAQINMQEIIGPKGSERDKAIKILAKSIFKELKSQGFESRQIVGLATELISHVTSDLASDTELHREERR
ncbi:MAG: hypothetical protein HY698_01245 [Deltaproteobacteria bacterium]|nr:hypothetical protein [Deltaproteobacteria bacterium]